MKENGEAVMNEKENFFVQRSFENKRSLSATTEVSNLSEDDTERCAISFPSMPESDSLSDLRLESMDANEISKINVEKPLVARQRRREMLAAQAALLSKQPKLLSHEEVIDLATAEEKRNPTDEWFLASFGKGQQKKEVDSEAEDLSKVKKELRRREITTVIARYKIQKELEKKLAQKRREEQEKRRALYNEDNFFDCGEDEEEQEEIISDSESDTSENVEEEEEDGEHDEVTEEAVAKPSCPFIDDEAEESDDGSSSVRLEDKNDESQGRDSSSKTVQLNDSQDSLDLLLPTTLSQWVGSEEVSQKGFLSEISQPSDKADLEVLKLCSGTFGTSDLTAPSQTADLSNCYGTLVNNSDVLHLCSGSFGVQAITKEQPANVPSGAEAEGREDDVSDEEKDISRVRRRKKIVISDSEEDEERLEGDGEIGEVEGSSNFELSSAEKLTEELEYQTSESSYENKENKYLGSNAFSKRGSDENHLVKILGEGNNKDKGDEVDRFDDDEVTSAKKDKPENSEQLDEWLKIQKEGDVEESGSSDKDEEEEEQEEDLNSSDDEVAVFRRLQGSVKGRLFEDKKKKLRSEFLEEEASLSGDDVGSDDDEEDQGPDEYEAEEGDQDDIPDEETLKEQLVRQYLKQQQDEEDRKLLYWKNELLVDGDLHGETDRTFRYKLREVEWQGLNEDGDEKREGEGNQEEDEEDLEQTKKRIEIVKWRLDNKEEETWDDGLGEDSPLLFAGMDALERQDSSNSSEPSQSNGSIVSRNSLLQHRNSLSVIVRQIGPGSGAGAGHKGLFLSRSEEADRPGKRPAENGSGKAKKAPRVGLLSSLE